MSWSSQQLIAEADTLMSRAEGAVRRYREARDTGPAARRAEQDLKRLQLYRAVLAHTNAAHALMPEFIAARRWLES
jgi:hypothetical protein